MSGVTLKKLKKITSVDKVVIHSIEGSIYIASVVQNGQELFLVDNNNAPIRKPNKLALQVLFEHTQFEEMVLRHESAYDEMIGQPDRDQRNTLEVSLGNTHLAQGSAQPFPKF